MISKQAIKNMFQDAVMFAGAMVGRDVQYVDARVTSDGLIDVHTRSISGVHSAVCIRPENLSNMICNGNL